MTRRCKNFCRLCRASLAIALCLALPVQTVFARGGGGGGAARGGGGGEGARGGGGGEGARASGGGGRPISPGSSHSSGFTREGGGGANKSGGGAGEGGIGARKATGGGEGIGGSNKSGNSANANNKSGNTVNANNKSGNSVNANNKSGNTVNANNKSGNTVNASNKSGNTINANNKSGNTVNVNNAGSAGYHSGGSYARGYANGYNHGYNNNWRHGNWNGGYGWGSVAAAGMMGWGLSSMYASSGYGGGYSNPYAASSSAQSGSPLNYSTPIQIAADPQSADGAGAADSSPSPEVAAGLVPFDASRKAFKAGDYDEALTKVEEALQKLPKDAALHEFRALVLFAEAKYKPAASALYAVLSAGPGWDWTTLSSMYPSVDVYQTQLRTLETFSTQNPDSPDAAFVLAYHYMTCGYKDQAATELKAVARILPDDPLAPRLLKLVGGNDDAADPPAPGATAQPAQPTSDAEPPVDTMKLVNTWKAASNKTTVIELTLKVDSTFVWKVTQAGKSNSLAGTYSIEDGNVLSLKQQSDGSTMDGKVTMADNGGFNFKLVETGPGDTGLNFAKK